MDTLSKMHAFKYLGNNMVYVEAGCHRDPDPLDPKGISPLDNSLLCPLNYPGHPDQLNQAGT